MNIIMQLIYSIQLKPPSMWGLYSTLSFGMLHDDYKLASLVIKELDKYQDDTECLEHYANLLSYFYLVQVLQDNVTPRKLFKNNVFTGSTR